MHEGTPIRDHLDRFTSLLLKLRNIDDKVAALMLLISLSLSYEYYVDYSINGKETVTLEEVKSSLNTRELRRKFCTLNDVRHVPQMTKNLISLSQLDSKGYSFKCKGGAVYFYKGSEVVLRGLKWGSLYFLQGRTLSGSVLVASSEVVKEDMTKLWHIMAHAH